MHMAYDPKRIADLLVAPREDLDCEVKNWLDLVNSGDDKATFAKAVIALANHGGGFVVFGLAEKGTEFVEAPGRPATLDGYAQDLLNGIVQNYCDPALHCAVHVVPAPCGAVYPVVSVPGGHRVPVRAKRSGPNGNTVQNNTIYVRKPGPRSETPTSSGDWDALLARCLHNRRDEMLDQIRDLIVGVVPQAPPPPEPDRLADWIQRSRARWEGLIATVPDGAGPRMPHGRYTVGYQILGEARSVSMAALPEILRVSVVRHTGWPPFWFPDRSEISPYVMDGAIECWIGGDTQTPPAQREAALSDFWRINPDGLAYLIRGYQEDGMQHRAQRAYLPASVFDLVLPVWRIGEAMLQAKSLADHLFVDARTIKFVVVYEGLAGRQLVSLDGRRSIWDGRVARQDAITLETHVEAQAISSNLPEVLGPLLSPLYALFDFFEPPATMVSEELAKMRSGAN